MHYSVYIGSRVNYSYNAFRCSPTPSSGSPGQLQAPWNTSDDQKHSLAARHRTALFHKEYTTLVYHKKLFTEVFVQ